MIELGKKQYIKATQRRKQIQVEEQDDLYKTIMYEQDDNIFLTNQKRGPQESIEEEYLSKQMKAPFIECLPNFQAISHLNQTIQQLKSAEDCQFRSIEFNEFIFNNQYVVQQDENYEFKTNDEQEYKIIEVNKLDDFKTFYQIDTNTLKNGTNKQLKKNLIQINNQGLLRKTIQK